MPNVLNEFEGDGVTRTFNFSMTGGYLSRDYVFFYTRPNEDLLAYTPYDDDDVTWISDYTVRTAAPIPVGTTFVIVRSTTLEPLVDFQNTSRITERNLDTATWQSIHIAAETSDVVSRIREVATAAKLESAEALLSAQTAASDAQTASSAAVAAVQSAVAAQASALQAGADAGAAALSAQAATDAATAAEGTANAAALQAATAIATANSAVSTANTAVSTANTANATAGTAVATATSASTTAGSAAADASAAVAAATTAVNTANTAVGAANTAVSVANEAKSLIDDVVAGGVGSFNGRTGAVTSKSGDYTKAQVGLGAVDNTSDANKPLSTAAVAALGAKADKSYVDTKLSSNAAADRDRANHTGYQPLSSLSQSGAEVGQVPKWTGSAWVPSGPDPTRAPLESPSFTGTPTAPTAPAGTNTKQIATTAFVTTAVSGVAYGLFYKADPTTVAFTKTGNGTASIKAGTKVGVAGTVVKFVYATAITMPALTAGTDYAIWVKDDATIQATANFSSAPSAGNWRKIGGFHYAPGGNAAAQAGGDTTPAINAYSLWDLKFRPACSDPRGMTLVAGAFWSDIYLLGVDHLTNGTSKYNVSIADGSAPPKIPTKFGGTGSNAYSTLNWWEANEVLQSWGKRSPTYGEFAALAYGTTEASSVGTDQGSTVLNAAYTSKWGCVQSSGCMWVWGGEFGGGAAASWTANTGGRGSTYQMENAVLFGGDWGSTSSSGSRASLWDFSPPYSSHSIGARGVCGHYVVD